MSAQTMMGILVNLLGYLESYRIADAIGPKTKSPKQSLNRSKLCSDP